MQTKHIPLNRAAAQYGFSDPNYVSKLYKKYYNESITQAAKATGFLPDDIFDSSKQNAKN